MASVSSSNSYIEDRQLVIDDLKEDGYLLGFGVRPESNNGRSARQAYTETGKAHVFPIEWSQSFGDDIQDDDKYYIVSDEHDISQCTHVEDNEGVWCLNKILTKFKPDNVTVIYYEIQVRRS